MAYTAGYGSLVHHVVVCLVSAYATNRTLVLESKGWYGAADGWESVFEPLSSTCTTTYDMPMVKWEGKLIYTTYMYLFRLFANGPNTVSRIREFISHIKLYKVKVSSVPHFIFVIPLFICEDKSRGETAVLLGNAVLPAPEVLTLQLLYRFSY